MLASSRDCSSSAACNKDAPCQISKPSIAPARVPSASMVWASWMACSNALALRSAPATIRPLQVKWQRYICSAPVHVARRLRLKKALPITAGRVFGNIALRAGVPPARRKHYEGWPVSPQRNSPRGSPLITAAGQVAVRQSHRPALPLGPPQRAPRPEAGAVAALLPGSARPTKFQSRPVSSGSPAWPWGDTCRSAYSVPWSGTRRYRFRSRLP
jgi:hypothetical protein